MSPVKSPEQPSGCDVGKKDKIVVEKDEADELPPGWTVKMRTRKSGSLTKVDRFYTDPETGYIFRSLRDAQRYVKTGEVGRLASKPKKNKCVDMDYKDEGLHMEEMSDTLRRKRPVDMTRSGFSETDESESLHRASRRLAAPSPPPPPPEPKTRKATRLAGIKADTPSRVLPEPKTRQATRAVAVDASPPTISPLEPKIRQATHVAQVAVDVSPGPPPSLPDTRTNHLITRQAGIKIDASVTPPPAPKTCQAAQQSGMKIESPPASSCDSKAHQATPSQQEPKTRQAKRLSGVRDDASRASLPQPKTRRATRQAGIKINSSPPSPSPPDTTSRQAARAGQVNLATRKENDKKIEADEKADMDNNPNHNQNTSVGTHTVFQENPKEHNKETEPGPATVVSPAILQKQELPVVNPTVGNKILHGGYAYGGDMKSDSSINFSMNDLWTDPCIEFAVKTLTGAIPCEDVNKPENPLPSPLKVPLEEIWTDPCIEFAVKTLTGAIPVREDEHIQQHRPGTSRNTRGPHDFHLPDVGMSFCQTDVLSKHFETGQNKLQQQNLTFGNGGLQKSGNIFNGQCSRSRFF